MISKELLSEILKEYKFPFSYEYNNYNDYTKKIYFYVNRELKIDFFSISIYELAHKCKEYSNKQGYRLLSGSHNYNNQPICYIYKDFDYIGDFCEIIISDSEQQAVFDACQWILDKGE